MAKGEKAMFDFFKKGNTLELKVHDFDAVTGMATVQIMQPAKPLKSGAGTSENTKC